MKILHVIASVDPKTGGPSALIRRLVRLDLQAGYQISLLSTTAQMGEPRKDHTQFVHQMRADPAFAGAEIFLGHAYGRHRPWSTFAYAPASIRWLRQRLTQFATTPDIIHIHGSLQYLTTRTAAIASQTGIPYVLSPYGTLDPVCLTMGYHNFKQLAARLLLGNLLKHAVYVQLASACEAAALAPRVAPDQMRIVPHGTDLPDQCPPQAIARFQQQFPALAGKRVILFLGRIHAIKRPELIVEALAQLTGSEYDDLILLLAGGDEQHLAIVRDTAQRLGLENRILHAGFLENDLKQAAFASASLLVLPSVHENFGLTIVEAMAHGIPVLTTPGVATHTYVDEAHAGLTVEPTPATLAQGIRTLLQADQEAMGQRGRAFVEKHLTWPIAHRQLHQLYADAIACSKQGGKAS